MLRQVARVPLPSHSEGGYDHADVHLKSSKVYIAHTGNNSVEVVDGEGLRHIRTVGGCPEASGVLCAQGEGLVFAAARGSGEILVIDCDTDRTVKQAHAGTSPNGLAWDSKRKHLLVADVRDNKARLLDPHSGKGLGELALRGRPRWIAYERGSDLILANIRDPPGVSLISPESLTEQKFVPISVQGPHGLELLEGAGLAFVACDGKALIVLDFMEGRELGKVPLSGPPDVLWSNPTRKLLYCAIGDPGVIDVIDTEKFAITERVVTEEGAHTLAFDGERQRLYSFMPKSQCAAVYSER